MLKLFNSLTRTIEAFKPLNPPHVTMYTCGPTVYDFAHIGNFRAYATSDVLVRLLHVDGYAVKFLMNITDVGHLTGDNLGDADTGEDKMEKSARKEGKTAWEVAQFYTDAFVADYEALNYTKPEQWVKATDHIQEQIDLIRTLEEQGYTYTTSDGVYFDTSKFKDYGKLSTLDQVKEGARVEINPEKRNPRDFALWKFSPEDEQRPTSEGGEARQRRQMEWESPWGKGFPGWHIECSAMSMKYLGETIDIHTGGVDHISVHHTNEIAQSEAATHKRFVDYWVHTAFMLVAGQKMSKSLGNVYRLYDLEKEGFEPLALRYLYLQTHYRQEMNFTFGALEAAQNALNHLRRELVNWDEASEEGSKEHEEGFSAAMNNDLNTPEALSVVWDMVKADIPSGKKLRSLAVMDRVLGLGLEEYRQNESQKKPVNIPAEVKELAQERQKLRKSKQFAQADQLRNKVLKMGFEIVDTEKGYEIKKA
jgi:cysteinyl-tRNA synthetase